MLPVLSSPAPEGCGLTAASPVKGCEDDCGLGLSDLQGEAVRDEIVQPVQGTADFSSCGSAPGGMVKKMESDSFCDAKRRQKAVLTKYKHGKFHVKVRKPLL